MWIYPDPCSTLSFIVWKRLQLRSGGRHYWSWKPQTDLGNASWAKVTMVITASLIFHTASYGTYMKIYHQTRPKQIDELSWFTMNYRSKELVKMVIFHFPELILQGSASVPKSGSSLLFNKPGSLVKYIYAGFVNIGSPIASWYIIDNPITVDCLGVYPVSETLKIYNYSQYSWALLQVITTNSGQVSQLQTLSIRTWSIIP